MVGEMSKIENILFGHSHEIYIYIYMWLCSWLLLVLASALRILLYLSVCHPNQMSHPLLAPWHHYVFNQSLFHFSFFILSLSLSPSLKIIPFSSKNRAPPPLLLLLSLFILLNHFTPTPHGNYTIEKFYNVFLFIQL